jgi:hypothetical protein
MTGGQAETAKTCSSGTWATTLCAVAKAAHQTIASTKQFMHFLQSSLAG